MNCNYSNLVIGNNTQVYTNCGWRKRIYFNNGGTTLILKEVLNQLNCLSNYYNYNNLPSFSSEQITKPYNDTRDIVKEYVGADKEKDSVIYIKDASYGTALFANILSQIDKDQIVLISKMEHEANYVPYAVRFKTILINTLPDGNIDLDDYKYKLELYQGRIKFVCVTGAANVSGIVTPIYKMAKLAHQYNAKIFVDIVQLLQHKPFTMKSYNDPEHIDFVVFSAHKIFTGLIGGALVGPKEFFDKYYPLEYSAGTTKFVDPERIILNEVPIRYEGGYPNLLGTIALGTSLKCLSSIGLNNIAKTEESLYQHLINGLKQMPNIILYGTEAKSAYIPFVAFNFKGIYYPLISQALGYNYGIEITSGKNAADIYIQTLLGLTGEEAYQLFLSGEDYGVSRVSLAFYNTHEEIDIFLEKLYYTVCKLYSSLR